MRKLTPILVTALAAGALVAAPRPGRATVETTPLMTLYSKAVPVDTAISGDGKVFFVLTDKHTVEVYDAQGVLQGTIDAGAGADTIRASASGDRIFLTNAAGKETKVLAVEFVKQIDITGSPFKGPADAPVVIAVFSDFQ